MTNVLTFLVTKPILNALLAALPQDKTTRETLPALAYAALYRDGTLASTDRYSVVRVDQPVHTARTQSQLDPKERPVALIHFDQLKQLVRTTPAKSSLKEGTPLTLDLDDPQGLIQNYDHQTVAQAITASNPHPYHNATPDTYPPILHFTERTTSPALEQEHQGSRNGLSPTTMNTAMKVCKALQTSFYLTETANGGKAFYNHYTAPSNHIVTLTTMPAR